MFTITDLIDLQTLSESAELEFKLAQGKVNYPMIFGLLIVRWLILVVAMLSLE